MVKVHISQFYSCSTVTLGSELLYISELGKYLMYNHASCLSLDGVILDSVLKKSPYWDYFRVAVSEGWVVDSGLSSFDATITAQNNIDYTSINKNFLFTTKVCSYDSVDTAQRNSSAKYNCVTPKPHQVYFAVQSSDAWVFTLSGNNPTEGTTNSMSLNSNDSHIAWVSFVAMVAVERLITHEPKMLCIQFSYVTVKNQLALSDFLLLCDETNAFTGWVIYSYEEKGITTSDINQLSYEAWWFKGKQQGYMSRWYSPKEKLKYLHTNLGLAVGDLVMLYERNYNTKFNYIKSIASCHTAIIRDIKGTSIRLEAINTVKTRYGAEVNFQNQTMAVKQMYCGFTSYKEWNSRVKNYDLADLGVGYMLHTEAFFITPLDQSDDILTLDVQGNGRVGKFNLPQNDAVYWILKDYDISFNEERFLARYFNNEETAYSIYMNGRDLPSEWSAV